MAKIILLLNPIYVTLFWVILLNLPSRNSTTAKKFLGKFMIFAFIVYLSHLFFYLPFDNIYPYFDSIYQFASLMVFPMYYIYLRLLTVDETFSIKQHFPVLILPFTLFILYSIGIIFSDFSELKIWIYDRNAFFDSLEFKYLNLVFCMIRFVFLAQVIYLVIQSTTLLKQYAKKAEQFYSDFEDGKNIHVKILNNSMILTGILSIVLASLGRDFFQDEIIMIAFASISFSVLLFIIGWMGFKQKSVSPATEYPYCPLNKSSLDENNSLSQGVLLSKISDLFENQKIYLNESLNIIDLANLTGTNRTYISHLINKHYQQNFCTFVNTYRMEEVQKYILHDPTCTNQILAEKCGFSSADSLKRVVKNLTGLSITELKQNLLK